MRFLQILLSAIWLGYGWLCYSAVQWQTPMEKPWHIEKPLEQLAKNARLMNVDTEKLLDRDIEEYKIRLGQPGAREAERADEHAILARCYWLKAYLQSSYSRQTAFLQMAVTEMTYALEYYLGQQYTNDQYINAKIAQYLYNVADLYHQLKEYDRAEEYYLEALRRLPGNPIFFRRYSEMIDESGRPSKMDYDTFSRPRQPIDKE